ncbi:hypothetical protein LTR85_000439 [Meristemomyces frigidus]|nr:hypothetical protein LTR85_000439 [Meristemomyces frigidus]
MHAASNPSVVAITGSWHTTAHAAPLISTLKAKGYSAQAHQLASVGLKERRPTFADDVEAIFAAVYSELVAGRDVTLLLHSYAGMPGAEAINRLLAEKRLASQAEGGRDGRARLARVIFLAAYVFPIGFIMDAAMMVGPENPNFTIDSDGMTCMANPRHTFFNDIASDDEAQQWVDKLEPGYCLGKGPVLSSDDWKTAAPVTAVLMKQDNAVPPARQEAIWQGHDSVWLEGSHTPYVSQPEKVANVIIEVIGKS